MQLQVKFTRIQEKGRIYIVTRTKEVANIFTWLSRSHQGLKKLEPPTLIAIRTAILVTKANQNNADPAKNAYFEIHLSSKKKILKI